MKDSSRTLLLIADISGFTEFMRLHAMATRHARQIVVRLLRAMIEATGPPLRVAELEGDAVFFYAVDIDENARSKLEETKKQILRLFRVFKREIEVLQQVPTCPCGACTSINNLRLKQVVHMGEVSIEPIQGFEKLFGLDVIVIHRMLKNHLPSREYLMITQPAYSAFADFYSLEPTQHSEEFEGVGAVDTVVFQEESLASAVSQVEDDPEGASLWQCLVWKFKMQSSTVLELLGIRKGRNPAAVDNRH